METNSSLFRSQLIATLLGRGAITEAEADILGTWPATHAQDEESNSSIGLLVQALHLQSKQIGRLVDAISQESPDDFRETVPGIEVQYLNDRSPS